MRGRNAPPRTPRTLRLSKSLLFIIFLFGVTTVNADQPLLTLEVESVILKWQDEFVLKLTIYGPDTMELPAVTIDGMDQFQLQGTGKNLLQIPRGKTKKWILTYTLLAAETGHYKVGPAILMHNGQSYRSNIVFISVEGLVTQKPRVIEDPTPLPEPPKKEAQKPAPEQKPEKKQASPPAKEEKKTPPPLKEEKKVSPPPQKEEKKPSPSPLKEEKKAPPPQKQEKKAPPAPPKPEKKEAPPKEVQKPPVEEPKPVEKEVVKPPVVITPEQIGDRIMILMDTPKTRPYQLQGIPVSVRLLSQLPVENLQFLEEADFPGFLRYDFPFTSKPKGEVVSFRNEPYASYELVKFLLFPLQSGEIQIPAVRCELKVRVPAGDFPGKDVKLDLERASNALKLDVKSSPEGAVVGDFVLKNEIVADDPESKVVRLILEGNGPLSTFDFPEVAGPHLQARKLNLSIAARMEGEYLHSRKTQDLEILPVGSTTSIVLPEIRIQEFNPESGTSTALRLPPMQFQFRPPGTAPKTKLLFPSIPMDRVSILFLILAAVTAFVHLRNLRIPRPRAHLRLQRLFSNKNLKLHISKSAARSLYQQIAMQISQQEKNVSSVNDAILKHLPQEEWLNIQRGLRKLERTAYSPTPPVPLTYEEMKRLCERIEALWIQ